MNVEGVLIPGDHTSFFFDGFLSGRVSALELTFRRLLCQSRGVQDDNSGDGFHRDSCAGRSSMSITENKVEETGFTVAGKPRWWTIRNKKGAREVVWMDLTGDEKSQGHLLAPVLFAELPMGHMVYPPFIVVTLRMGPAACLDLLDKGGKVHFRGTDKYRKLHELCLMSPIERLAAQGEK